MAGKNFFGLGGLAYNPFDFEGEEMQRLQVRFYGDWEKTIRMLQTIDPVIKEAGLKAQAHVGEQILEKVRKHLRNQDLGWRSLNQKYEAKKAKRELDTRILIAWGTYYHSIKVWQRSNQHI